MNAPAKVSRASRVQNIVTPAGIKAWLVEDYAVPLVAMDFSFEGGAAQDPQGKAGRRSILAGMLDEGAGDLDSEAFQRALDDYAIRLHFSADRDEFTGHMQTLTRNLDKAFELATLALNAPRFDAEPLERVRGQINAALKRESKDPDAMAAKAWRRAAWPGHPYARSARGELGEVDAIVRDDLVVLYKSLLARDTLKVAVVGAIDAATLSARLDALFGGLPAHARAGPCRRSRCRPRPAHAGRPRCAAGQHPLRPAGHRAPRSRISSPRPWSTTSGAAGPSPRGCGRRCAKSAA